MSTVPPLGYPSGRWSDARRQDRYRENRVLLTRESVAFDIAPIGIITQHETADVEINDNEISDLLAADSTDSNPDDGVDFDFTFAQGINITSPSTSNTEVRGNEIRDITSEELTSSHG